MERVHATAEHELGGSTLWMFSPRTHPAVAVEARHPASHGMVLEVADVNDDASVSAAITAWLRQREFRVADEAPRLEHPDLVLGVRTLAQAFEWPAIEVRAVAFLLFEAHVLLRSEAAWLAGFVAPDAPMKADPPTAA